MHVDYLLCWGTCTSRFWVHASHVSLTDETASQYVRIIIYTMLNIICDSFSIFIRSSLLGKGVNRLCRLLQPPRHRRHLYECTSTHLIRSVVQHAVTLAESAPSSKTPAARSSWQHALTVKRRGATTAIRHSINIGWPLDPHGSTHS
jgi:hypothetical protein